MIELLCDIYCVILKKGFGSLDKVRAPYKM